MDINFIAFADKVIDAVAKGTNTDLTSERSVIITEILDNDTIDKLKEISGCEINESKEYVSSGYYYNMCDGVCISVVDLAYDMIECIDDNVDINLNDDLVEKLLDDIGQIIMETLSPFREVVVMEINKPGLPEQIAIPAYLTFLDDGDLINEFVLNVAESYNAVEIYESGYNPNPFHGKHYTIMQVPCTEELKKQLDVSDEFLPDIYPDMEKE